MAGRISRSLDLAKASWNVVRADKELLWLPIMSTGALLLLIGSFAVPSVMFGDMARVTATGETPPIFPIAAFLFYLIAFFIAIFFNTALVGAAMMRMDGGDPTVRDGLAIAWARVGRIFGYALIAATVGLLLRALEERVGWLGRIVIRLIGVAWGVATFLVVPILVMREVGPVDAIKESASLLRETWGENVIGTAGLAGIFIVAYLLVCLAAFGLAFVGAQANLPIVVIAAIVLGVVALVVLTALQATMQAVYSAALYRYATNSGSPTPGFDSDAMQLAFKAKG